MKNSELHVNGTRKYHTFSGDHDNDYFEGEDDMSPSHWELLMGCHHQGSCDNDTEEASKYFEIEDYIKAVNYLIDCGIERERFLGEESEIKYPQNVTSEDQIEDRDAVLTYYLWVLAGDIQERIKEENDNDLGGYNACDSEPIDGDY